MVILPCQLPGPVDPARCLGNPLVMAWWCCGAAVPWWCAAAAVLRCCGVVVVLWWYAAAVQLLCCCAHVLPWYLEPYGAVASQHHRRTPGCSQRGLGCGLGGHWAVRLLIGTGSGTLPPAWTGPDGECLAAEGQLSGEGQYGRNLLFHHHQQNWPQP